MNRSLARAVVLAAALTLPAAAKASIAESWYLARGRANMKIANFAAAIEAYEKALGANPASREASSGLARAHEANGDTDRAVAARDRHLARFPDDAEVAFEQARVLQWSRYAYRWKDAIRYLEMGLARRDDLDRRIDLARLLGRERATLDRALVEYRRVLAARPSDDGLREEYVKLLRWDPRHRTEAVRELERRAAERPGDAGAQRDLANLLATDARTAGEAADRYGALLAARPAEGGLRLARARALALAGRGAEAREEYARVLSAGATPEVRLEYADLLAAHPETRARARPEYEAVLAARPGSRRARVGLARLLGERKETSKAAIAHYEEVLARAPGDAEAHRGLARAYAWNGDPDRAFAHGAEAARSGPPTGEVAALERSLRRGREPALGGAARALAQPGALGLREVAALASGRADPTAFTSSAVEAGAARASGGEGPAREGAVLDARGEVRPHPGLRLEARVGWDGLRLGNAVSGGLRVALGTGARTLSLAAGRSVRRDSFRARAGERVGDALAGAASEDALEVSVAAPLGRLRAQATVRAGAISAASRDPNPFAAGWARAEAPLALGAGWTVAPGAEVLLSGAARDESGLGPGADPLAPGTFTPPLFAAQSLRLRVSHEGMGGRLDLEAGPALQVVRGSGQGAQVGGTARAAFAQDVGRLRWSAEIRGESIAGAYDRIEGGLSAAVAF